jgi:DNA gyrase subunit A
LANPQARGKALVNMLPLAQGEKISVVLPMPNAADGKDEQMNMLFATSHGTVRRNRISDFRNIRSNGLIAMKLGDDERLISVKVASDDQDVLLFSKQGKAIRFAIDELRVFAGRTSTGVRGINLGAADEVIGMSVLKNVPATSDERTLYLKLTNAERRLTGDDGVVPNYAAIVAEAAQTESMTEARYQELTAIEEYLLTVTDRGFGKRTSAFEYRQTGRGGQGITNIDLTDKNGVVVASYPVAQGCDLLLVTDAGQMIRTPANQIRVAGRATQGVTLFRVAADESVVSVEVIGESDDDANDNAQLPEVL